MAREPTSTQMEESLKASGCTEKETDLGPFSLEMVKLFMKESGKMGIWLDNFEQVCQDGMVEHRLTLRRKTLRGRLNVVKLNVEDPT